MNIKICLTTPGSIILKKSPNDQLHRIPRPLQYHNTVIIINCQKFRSEENTIVYYYYQTKVGTLQGY